MFEPYLFKLFWCSTDDNSITLGMYHGLSSKSGIILAFNYACFCYIFKEIHILNLGSLVILCDKI
jgi:hypothetical protein